MTPGHSDFWHLSAHALRQIRKDFLRQPSLSKSVHLACLHENPPEIEVEQWAIQVRQLHILVNSLSRLIKPFRVSPGTLVNAEKHHSQYAQLP
jgi:hypothetical protein